MSIGKSSAKEKIPKHKKMIPKKKKSLIIGAIVAAVAIAGIVGGIIFIEQIGEEGGTCTIGIDIRWSIEEIDPLTTLYEAEIITHQVAETLFDNDFSGSESRLIYTLTTNYSWSDNATELTCSLRQGVMFHDGTPFNATAVKWNFDRMYHLVNTSLGAIVYSWGYLFILPDGRWIVNETQVVDEYTVKFVLNEPFVPFLQFLTHHSTSILSPTSTPFDEILNFLTDDIVGTGPFIYDEYILNSEIRMSSNPNYWGVKPKIDNLILKYYDTVDDLWDAFLAQNVTILDPIATSLNFYSEFPNKSLEMLIDDPKFTVQETQGSGYNYIGMNNIKINVTMRKAISYAFNYSNLIEEILPLISVRARSPVPEGILYSNTTAFNVPYYNISFARQILINGNWPRTTGLTANNNISEGNKWEKLVSNNTPIETYNISYWARSPTFSLIATLVREDLKQIGIKVNLVGDQFPANHLYIFSWGYDYNDPHNALYTEFSSKSSDNMVYGSHLNDSLVDQWIEEGVKETDPVLRKQIYYKIQERLIEALYASVWTFSFKKFNIFDSNLKGWQPNPLSKNLFKTIYFV